jgi:UDP-glucuronate 4-epimerase
MKNILVTGGAGFIGSHVCDRLLDEGYKVICLDNFDSYYSPTRKIKNIQYNLTNPNFDLVELDIRDLEGLNNLFKEYKIDKVIHLAARAGVRPSIENPLPYEDANVKGTINLLEMCRKYNIRDFIFASSSSIYGKNKKIPFNEEDNVDFPISPYAATKKSGELICHAYGHLFDMNITCLRFFTVYGPRGRPDMAPYLFTKLIDQGKPIMVFGDGTTKRDYTYISDIVDGVMSALRKPFKFKIINLGNNKPIELRNFISIIEKNIGKKAIINRGQIPLGDVFITYADITKAKEFLDYVPKISIEEGMERFIEWYKSEFSP